ncbi:MAG: hypothetical protein OXU19_07900, partial [bacterium]|nr:hypothetical protein [bacterium]
GIDLLVVHQQVKIRVVHRSAPANPRLKVYPARVSETLGVIANSPAPAAALASVTRHSSSARVPK